MQAHAQHSHSSSQHMLLDSRLLGSNATDSTRDQWARDCWPQIELIWGYMIILALARLMHIDPLVVHFLCALWKFLPGTNTLSLSVTEIEYIGR